MTMHKALDRLWQETKKEGNSPALGIALIQQFEEYTKKKRPKKVWLQQPVSAISTEITLKQIEKQKWKIFKKKQK